MNALCGEIREITASYSGDFYAKAADIMEKYSVENIGDMIAQIHSYPDGAKSFVKFFCENIQPELKKHFSDAACRD